MTDFELAKNNLAGHTICLCRDGKCLYSDKRGIAPMTDFIADGVELSGYAAADLIVGRAAAMLFVKCGVKEVFAKVLSAGGEEVLKRYGVPYEYETLTEKIVNRAGTDICPMEKAVTGIDDPQSAYEAIAKTLAALRTGR